jgi:hypothetical protein
MKTASLLMLLLTFILTGCQSASLKPAPAAEPTSPNAMPHHSAAVPGEYLLKLNPQVPDTAETRARLQQIFQSQTVQSIRAIGNGWYLLVLQQKTGSDTELSVVQQLAEHSGLIEAVQPNLPYRINPPSKPALTGDGF